MKTLNVGAGQRTYTHYPNENFECINIDIRKVEGIDVVCDVTDLSQFGDEEFDFILASDIIEHFPIAKTTDILNEWSRVLKKGGIIEFRAPNLEAICKQYNGNNAKHTSWLLYGAQSYKTNFHYVAFDRKWLRSIIEPLGFKEKMFKKEGTNFIMGVKKL